MNNVKDTTFFTIVNIAYLLEILEKTKNEQGLEAY